MSAFKYRASDGSFKDIVVKSSSGDVEISKAEGNIIEKKNDGIYVPSSSVAISKETDNAIEQKTDGLYVSKTIDIKISEDEDNAIVLGTDGGIYVDVTEMGGTTDYENLQNKPTINDTELSGNLTTEDLGIISEDDNNAAILGNDGNLFVEDKTVDIERIEAKADRINIAQKTVNTELDYFHGYGDKNSSTNSPKVSIGMNFFPYLTVNVSTNMKYENEYLILNGGKTYRLEAHCLAYGASNSQFQMDIQNYDTGVRLSEANMGYMAVSQYNSTTPTAIVKVPEGKTLKVCVKFTTLTGSGTVAYTSYAYFIAQEIGRDIVVDPVSYVNTTNGIEDTPVGHILTYMGKTAPKHYLVCDGKEYNITDYRYLAQFIKDEYGSFNFFGGDGQTTFAVPDLQGEFLRGAGRNSHVNQGSGAEVGEHQNGTTSFNAQATPSPWMVIARPSGVPYPSDEERQYDFAKSVGSYAEVKGSATSNTSLGYTALYTSRPTNTSVLYCIKYEPTYFMHIGDVIEGEGSNINYATDEEINNILKIFD